MFLTIAHIFFYALIQTAAFAMIILSMRRLNSTHRPLQKIAAANPVAVYFFILTVNAAGTMTFGELAWQTKSRPIAAGLFLLFGAVFVTVHLFLAAKKLRR